MPRSSTRSASPWAVDSGCRQLRLEACEVLAVAERAAEVGCRPRSEEPRLFPPECRGPVEPGVPRRRPSCCAATKAAGGERADGDHLKRPSFRPRGPFAARAAPRAAAAARGENGAAWCPLAHPRPGRRLGRPERRPSARGFLERGRVAARGRQECPSLAVNLHETGEGDGLPGKEPTTISSGTASSVFARASTSRSWSWS